MKKRTSLTTTAHMILLAVLLHGCATSPARKQSVVDVADSDTKAVVQHIVKPGDRLGDIALQYTGEIGQWQTIATYNNITNPKHLKVGDVITIPSWIVPEGLAKSADDSLINQSLVANKDSLDAASIPVSQASLTAATTNTLAVKRSSAIANEISTVVVRPVSINRTFELNPIDQSDISNGSENNTPPPQIKVIGTYFPKGIYQQPASYSKLLMRVAPGSVFELELEVNDWYKIVTTNGIGYLRAEDGVLVSVE